MLLADIQLYTKKYGIRPTSRKDIAQVNPDKIGVFSVLTAEILTSDFVDVKKTVFTLKQVSLHHKTKYLLPSAWIRKSPCAFLYPLLRNQEVTQMTIYQEEMQRKAFRYGCTTEYDAEDQLLTIAHNGIYLTGVTDEGFMRYTSKDLSNPEACEVFEHLLDDARIVREYVKLYETSQQMKPEGARNYRKFAEYDDVVFAGMYSQKHGFMFCSWRQIPCTRQLFSRLPLIQGELRRPHRTN